MHFGQFDLKAAHIDAIQTEQRLLGGETPARRIETAKRPAECFDHPKAMGQQFISIVPPVVEVTGDDEGGVGVVNALDASGESIHLAASRGGEHREMDTDTVQRSGRAWQLNGAMQQTPPLETKVSDVLVVRMFDRKTSEDRVAMVPMPVHHVAAISGG